MQVIPEVMPNVWLKVGGGAETKHVMLTSECTDNGRRGDPVEDLKEGEWAATEGGSARLQCRCVSPFLGTGGGGGGTPVTCTPTLVENKRKNKYRRDVRECKQVCIFPVSGNKREPTTDTRKTSTFTFFFFLLFRVFGRRM